MGKKPEKRDELREKQKSYQKKLRKIGEDLAELQRAYEKEQKKLKAKHSSYEEKLAKIDENLKGIRESHAPALKPTETCRPSGDDRPQIFDIATWNLVGNTKR